MSTMDFPRGWKIDGSTGKPANWVGDIGSHDDSTPERVRIARRNYTHDEATGSEYTEVGGAPLLSSTPADLHISMFVVAHGRLVFLRPRGDLLVERYQAKPRSPGGDHGNYQRTDPAWRLRSP